MTEAGTLAMTGSGSRGGSAAGSGRGRGQAHAGASKAVRPAAAPADADAAAGRDDADLVARARRGDGDAFGALAGRYFGTVYAVAYARLRQREAAEDLAQETMLRAYLSLGTLTDPTRFAAWTTRQARNLAIDWLRRGAVRSRLLTMVPLTDDGIGGDGGGNEADAAAAATAAAGGAWWDSAAAALPAGDPRRALVERQERDALHRALGRLPADQRELLLLRHAEDVPANEIARRLGLHPSTVGRQLDRAAESMRQALANDMAAGDGATAAAPAFDRGAARDRPLASRPPARARAVAVAAAAACLAGESRRALAAAAAASPVPAASATASLSYAVAKGITAMGVTKIAATAAGLVAAGFAATWIAAGLHSGGFSGASDRPARETVVQGGWETPADILIAPGERAVFKWPAGNRARIAQSSLYLSPQRELNGNYRTVAGDGGGSFMYDLKRSPVNIVSGLGPDGILLHLTAANEGDKVRVRVNVGLDAALPAKSDAVEAEFKSGRISNAVQRRRLSELLLASEAAPADPAQRALFEKAVAETVQDRTAPPNLPLPAAAAGTAGTPDRLRRDP